MTMPFMGERNARPVRQNGERREALHWKHGGRITLATIGSRMARPKKDAHPTEMIATTRRERSTSPLMLRHDASPESAQRRKPAAATARTGPGTAAAHLSKLLSEPN